MARTQNLSEYLTDIATAIKTKKGDETPINASKFDEEIINLPSGGSGGIDVEEYFKTEATNLTDGYVMNYLIKKIPPVDVTQIKNLSYMFNRYSSLKTIPNLNTSNATNMTYMFSRCTSLETIPNLNTSNVTNMSYMMNYCTSLKTVPNLDTSNVTNMSWMFGMSNNIETIPQLNASKVTNAQAMFSTCSALTNFGGLYNLGEAYSTTTSANSGTYSLALNASNNLTYDSLMNVINKLYDIASKGVKTQKLVLGSENLAKLTAEEINIAVEKGWSVS